LVSLSGGYRLRAKKVKIHQLRAVVSWDIHWVYINYAQRLLSTFSSLILIVHSGPLVFFHRAFGLNFNSTHPHIFTFVDAIINTQISTYIKLNDKDTAPNPV
ncbi:hypothetical protein C0J52_00977, partial [Blattella germanica]